MEPTPIQPMAGTPATTVRPKPESPREVSMPKYAEEHVEILRTFTEQNSALLRRLRRRNRFFHSQVNRLIQAQMRPDCSIIDLGCGDGEFINLAAPTLREAVGVDVDGQAIADARARARTGTFIEAAVEELTEAPLDRPDYIVMSMLLDQVYDVHTVLRTVHEWSARQTRIIVVTYNRLWRPLLRLAELLRLKAVNPNESYVPRAEVENLLETCGFEITKRLDGVLIPIYIPLVSRLVNRWIAPLPLFRHLGLVHMTVARPLGKLDARGESVSIVIAARNEEGHIRELIERIPEFGSSQEIIFVEGGSADDTWGAIQRVTEEQSGGTRRVIALKQQGQGKGDAVRAGFARAQGDILMILDADISVPPEELPRFYEALRMDVCEFANGSRLIYPMEDKAMRFLNMVGNKFFGLMFSYLLGQPVRDTLCGTKVLRRSDYERIAANRGRFGELDPFGDFDLLFGASAQGMRIRDVPIHYKERRYGTTNISRFRHGILLLRMSRLAAARVKFIG